MSGVVPLVALVVLAMVPAAMLAGAELAVPISGAVLLLCGGVGASVAVLSGTSVWLWTAICTVAAIAGAAALAIRRDRRLVVVRSRRVWTDVVAGAVVTAPAVFLLSASSRPPTGWDPRYIWWFKARWFAAGPTLLEQSLNNSALSFAHRDYPPGPPSVVNAVWKLGGTTGDFVVALDVHTVLTGLAVGAVAAALYRWWRHPASLVVGVALAVALATADQGWARSGYVDLLAAAFATLAVVAFCLPSPDGGGVPPAALRVGALAVAAAALTKGEGMLIAAAMGVVAVAANRREWRRIGSAVGLGLAPALVWQAVIRIVGYHDDGNLGDVGPSSALSRVFSREGLHRGRRAFEEVVHHTGWHLALATVCVVGVWLVSRRGVRLRLPLMLVIGAWVAAAISVMVYVVGVLEIEFWLRTSLVRVTSSVRTLSLTAVAVSALAVLRPGEAPATMAAEEGDREPSEA